MGANTQFSMAVHILTAMAYSGKGKAFTSSTLAKTVNTNPVVIRRLLAALAGAGILNTTRGKSGGVELAKIPSEITLYDIYQAVHGGETLVAMHGNEEVKHCPVSCRVRDLLGATLVKAQKAFERELKSSTLESLAKGI